MPRHTVVHSVLVLIILGAGLPAGLAQPGEHGPFADFVYSPQPPVANETVVFTSVSRGDAPLLVHRWSFGDGSDDRLALGPEMEHTFAKPGTYEVTLTVTDARGASGIATRIVWVENSAPHAAFDAAPSPAFRGQTIVFQDNSTDPDGDALVSWEWSFGDGTTATGATATHAYSALGSYEVRLVVTDTYGKQGTARALVRVLNAPPKVSASFSPEAPRTGDTVTFIATAFDPDGDSSAVTYAWSFSDGATASGATVERTFATSGRYGATVRAKDSEGALSEPVSLAVRVDFSHPTANFSVSPAVPVAGQVAQFEDASGSPNGAIVSRSWDFGDGSVSSQPSPKHVFARGGHYFVTLTVADEKNQSSWISRPVRVNAPPKPMFGYSPSTAIGVGEPISFTDFSTDLEGPLVSWRWRFGDGAESALQNPSHAYAAPGSYAVELEVTDSDGASATHARTVQVVNQPPVAAFSYSPHTPLAGEPVQFVSDAFDPDGAPLKSWSWSFGDGATSTAEHPVHTYSASGRRLVSLAVSDGLATSRAYAFVDVAAGHAFAARIAALLPDGRHQDLGAPEIQVRATHLRAGVATDVPLELDGHEAIATLAAGAWMQGDALRLSVRDARYMSEARETALVLRDGQSEVSLRIPLPMPLAPTLEVAPGASDPLGSGAERAPDGTPLYRDPTEGFHGAGQVLFLDGVPASGAGVEISVRRAGAADTAWCTLARAQAGADGRFDWRAREDSTCVTSAPGRYEVQARAMLPTATAGLSEKALVLVDPTGTGAAGAGPA